MITSKNTKKRGFTIIETLIAIFILSLAITGPMVYVADSFHLAKQAKYKMIAYFLALESLEEIKFARDNTIGYDTSGDDWAVAFDLDDRYFDWDKSAGSDGDFAKDCGTEEPTTNNPAPCGYLDYTDDDGYHYGALTDQESVFYRYIKITSDSARLDERKAFVVVGWNDGIVDGELNLTEFIYNLNN